MKSEDTVMDDALFLEWCGNHKVKGCGKSRTMIDEGEEIREVTQCEDCRAEAQAEISFKAGRMEVVEWIQEHNNSAHKAIVFVCPEEWQAQKKEWGVA